MTLSQLAITGALLSKASVISVAKVGVGVAAIVFVAGLEGWQIAKEQIRKRREPLRLCVNEHDSPGGFGS